jgi:DNA-directed RNA polymerase specialized sigma24 family protein
MKCYDGPLSNFYQRYKAGNMTARDLEAGIFEYFLSNYSNQYGLYFRNRCERIDFLCWAYPRMRNAIERYDSAYASFDAYVASTIRYSYRNYKSREKKRAAMENACWNASGDGGQEVREQEAVYQDTEIPPGAYRVKSPKRALLVLLKSYYYVSDELVRKAARVLGMTPEVLGGMIDTLYGLQLEKIMRLRRLANAVHSLYFRCLDYERQLSDSHENPQISALLSRRLERGRARLANMRNRLRSTRIEATNSSLAKLLGVPKGTIDSRLAFIKNKLSGNQLRF